MQALNIKTQGVNCTGDIHILNNSTLAVLKELKFFFNSLQLSIYLHVNVSCINIFFLLMNRCQG